MSFNFYSNIQIDPTKKLDSKDFKTVDEEDCQNQCLATPGCNYVSVKSNGTSAQNTSYICNFYSITSSNPKCTKKSGVNGYVLNNIKLNCPNQEE